MPEDKAPAPNFDDFLANFGKTLGRINLYSLNHPLVQESIRASYESLAEFLKEESEIILASSEGKLLLNGVIVTGLPAIQQSLVQFYEKNQIYSVAFRRGLTAAEVNSLYKIFTGSLKGGPERFTEFLAGEDVKNILINSAFFSKVGEKTETSEGTGAGTGVGAGAGAGKGGEAAKEATAAIIRKLESLSLDNMLWEIIRKAVPNPEDQKKVFEIIFRQIENDLKAQVEKATHSLKQEKQKIQNEQERTESVIQTMAEGVVMVDNEGRIVMMNPVAEKIYGRAFSAVKGRKIEELAGDELMISFAKELASPGDRGISKEVFIQSSMSTQKTLKQSTAMIENPEGRVVGIVSILNDIAKQRELQRMQDQFLANVTHELRSPLTAIKASIATIASDTETKIGDQERNMLNIANRNIDRLARLINDILDFGKIAEGKVTISPRPIDTKLLIQDSIAGLESWAKTKQIAVEYSPEGPVPKVMGDSDRMTQVMVNLLSNAIKFTPGCGRIKVTTEKSPLTVKVSVTDTGPGIPKKDQEKLFQKFFQLKQTQKMDMPGTGLGLFITKRIIELHQGEIGFTSEEGKGSTFWFTLPIVPESAVKEAARAAAAAAGPAKKKGWFSKIFGK